MSCHYWCCAFPLRFTARHTIADDATGGAS